MKKIKFIIPLLFSLAVSTFAERGNVTILYTNDVHTYISNTVKNAAGEKVPGLSYGSITAMKKDLAANGENVILVDAGDHIQGTAYGAMDSGKSIIQFMNAAGYDAATLGNHEFDYGTARTLEVIKEAAFPYVSCNFYNVKNGKQGKPVLQPYTIVKFGKTKVAFIGICTPETYTKSTPAYFMDEKMENYIYKFAAGTDGKELYDSVQAAIKKVSKKADYVIALGHLGDDPASAPWTSEEVIAHTTGLDAFIDGHSHSTVEQKIVKDAAGKDVVLSQTGSFFAKIGKMNLSDKAITSSLISSYENTDETVNNMVTAWAKTVDEKLNEKIAVTDINFYINNPENPKDRLIRKQETNLGDLVPDAVYYYFNNVEKLNCDVAIGNGGGIRVDTPSGDFSYNSAKKIQPFGNIICLVEVTGQDILDAFEWTARSVGVGECGGFLHVAGAKYTIDPSVPSTVQSTPEGLWAAGPANGVYRVKDVAIYNKETGAYEPLDLTKTYTMGGINYTLRNMGDGCAMFGKSKLVKDYIGEDYLITSEYVKSFAKNADGVPSISTQNSPLTSYAGYLINYENPNGAGRITILSQENTEVEE